MLIKDKYIKINIREYLALGADDDAGEPALDRLLSEFSCPKNPDVLSDGFFYPHLLWKAV